MNLHTIFYSGCTYLHSHQKCIKVLFSLYPLQHFVCFVLLIISIITTVRWYLSVALFCISLVAGEVEHHFINVLVIYISCEKSVCSGSLLIFKIVLWICCWLVWVFCIFWILATNQSRVCKYPLPFGWLFWCLFVCLFMLCSFLIWYGPSHLCLLLLPFKLGSSKQNYLWEQGV